jgi:hypothetical protein
VNRFVSDERRFVNRGSTAFCLRLLVTCPAHMVCAVDFNGQEVALLITYETDCL